MRNCGVVNRIFSLLYTRCHDATDCIMGYINQLMCLTYCQRYGLGESCAVQCTCIAKRTAAWYVGTVVCYLSISQQVAAYGHAAVVRCAPRHAVRRRLIAQRMNRQRAHSRRTSCNASHTQDNIPAMHCVSPLNKTLHVGPWLLAKNVCKHNVLCFISHATTSYLNLSRANVFSIQNIYANVVTCMVKYDKNISNFPQHFHNIFASVFVLHHYIM